MRNITPRLFHRIYAFVFGYFWLPCPICGNYFGGHECGGTLMQNFHSGKAVCRNCTKEADRHNDGIFRNNHMDIRAYVNK